MADNYFTHGLGLENPTTNYEDAVNYAIKVEKVLKKCIKKKLL